MEEKKTYIKIYFLNKSIEDLTGFKFRDFQYLLADENALRKWMELQQIDWLKRHYSYETKVFPILYRIEENEQKHLYVAY